MNQAFLNSSQASSTKYVIEISKTIAGEGVEYLLNSLAWLHKNISRQIPEVVAKNDVFRKRTAEQIIKDKYYSGCTDYALVFVALARSKGIPTKYVEAIKKSWLKDGDENHIEGHIFAECLIGDKWIQVDPQMATIYALQNYSAFEIYEKGGDSWDLGIKSFEDLKNKFTRFRENYLAKSV